MNERKIKMQSKEYIKTYFRINCGYEMRRGMDEQKYELLKYEIKNIFEPLGFKICQGEIYGSSDTAYRNKESLYLHPMNFSGYILEPTINEIEAAIKASGLNLTGIDTYEILYDEDADFLQSQLQAAKNEIREEIFDNYKTTRKAHYVMKGFSTDKVTTKLFDKGLNNKIYGEFISDLRNEMVKQGLLIEAKLHPGYYRSLNKTELKVWERKNGPIFSKVPIIEQTEEKDNLFTMFKIDI